MRILDLRDFFLSVTIITIMMPLYVGGWILDSTLELLPIARRKPAIQIDACTIEPVCETQTFQRLGKILLKWFLPAQIYNHLVHFAQASFSIFFNFLLARSKIKCITYDSFGSSKRISIYLPILQLRVQHFSYYIYIK